MSRERPIRGACSCGRNRYSVEVPPDSDDGDVAQVFFETRSDHRRHLAAPLTAFLRIPLTWYRSTTYAFFPDESHAAIRRAYTAPAQPHTMRHFCGYCGTPLSYWTEQPPDEARFISLTLGSLVGEDLRELEELGLLLPPSRLETAPAADTAAVAAAAMEAASGLPTPATTTAAVRVPIAAAAAAAITGAGGAVDYGAHDDDDVDDDDAAKLRDGVFRDSAAASSDAAGLPWFEALMEGSRLGRMSRHRQRVQRTDASGSALSVEWEIIEWTGEASGGSGDSGEGADNGDADVGNGNGSGAGTPAKRKHGELDEGVSRGGGGDGSGAETASASRATAEVEMSDG